MFNIIKINRFQHGLFSPLASHFVLYSIKIYISQLTQYLPELATVAD